MVIKIRKKVFNTTICVVLSGMICCLVLSHLINLFPKPSNIIIGGGILHLSLRDSDELIPVMNQESNIGSERFQRPSKELPYPNPYSFKDIQKEKEKSLLVTKKFENPEDLILAYYGILREASNMLGYSGGCGTTSDEGWKIKSIDYIPEDFLCAPMHHWFYLSDAVVQIVYGDNLKLI